MFRTFKVGFNAILALILVSCAGKVIYTYNNVNYNSPEPAIAAHKAELDAMLSKVTPTNHPVGGSAVVILPTKENVKKTVVDWKGQKPRQKTKDKISDFGATMFLNGLRANGEALEKRRIFDTVAMANNDDPENASFNEDVAILLLKKDAKDQWFMKKKKGNSSALVTIDQISTALPPAQRLILWLDKVEKAARER